MVSSRHIVKHIMTLLLFMKSNMLTVMIPIIRSLPTSAHHPNITHILDVITWIWLHLLKHDICNQMQDPEEDRKNKPDRPLPAGHITVQNAADVHWLLVPVCLIFSAMYGSKALTCSTCVEALNIWYNEFDGDKITFSKNILTAIIYVTFELGTTVTIGTIDKIGACALAFNLVMFATTLHTQNFKDEEGDQLTERHTLVTLFPTFACMSMLFGIPLWSFGLSRFWKVDLVCSVAFIAYGTIVRARFMVYRTPSAHKQCQ
ncbi:UbiA prenyltransferase family-domain-containing protein [Suillus spraguei]|nr:UbiA prenyltransferase family-domain-containing protein [Suillus spraguei]